LLVLVVLLFAASPALAAEESGDPLASLGINLGFLIAQIINFLLLFGILTYFLWNPLRNMMDSRTAEIQKGLEDASAAANARRNAEAEAEKILSQARSEAAQVVEDARVRGEEVAKQIEQEARSDADRIRQDARTDAQAERNAQLASLRDQIVAISMAVAQRLIGENLNEGRQREIISDFFSRLPAEASAMTGPVTVVSAIPLTDDEQQRVRSELNSDDITFDVDPSILGGLIIRSGDRVVDGSIRRDMTSLAGRMN
jgi:F-type H+-transporting ATPase subunit b